VPTYSRWKFYNDLLTTTQCTVIEHSDYTPMSQQVSPWYELVINFSTQLSPTLRLSSASWGWASNVQNMSRLWTSIKWKVKCVSSWYCLLRNYVTIIHGQQKIKFYNKIKILSFHSIRPACLISRFLDDYLSDLFLSLSSSCNW
jgi:hypothetical protein